MGILTDFGLPAMAIFSIDHDFSVWGARSERAAGGGEAGRLDGFPFREPLAFEVGEGIVKAIGGPVGGGEQATGLDGGDGFCEIFWVVGFEEPFATGAEEAVHVLAKRGLHESVFGVFGLGPGVGKEQVQA